MPSASEGASTPLSPPPQATAVAVPCGPAAQLAHASRALWAATLSLMTAFMQTAAPAHRYLLARRIAGNFETLSAQDCFDARSRASFERLGRRWRKTSEQFSPHRETARGSRGLLRFLS